MTQYDPFTMGWFVGLFEGEGSFLFADARPTAISIEMTDYDTLLRVQNLFGGSLYSNSVRNDNWKPTWRWSLRSNEAIELAKLILPHLSARRSARCQEFITNYVTMDMYNELRLAKREDNLARAKEFRLQGLTHQAIADRLGLERSYVSRLLRA